MIYDKNNANRLVTIVKMTKVEVGGALEILRKGN